MRAKLNSQSWDFFCPRKFLPHFLSTANTKWHAKQHLRSPPPRATATRPRRTSCTASMSSRCADISRRRGSARAMSDSTASTLQWGRRHKPAERRSRSSERLAQGRLQWGRRHTPAERRMNAQQLSEAIELQWGRRHKPAESYEAAKARGVDHALQWGRRHKPAESPGLTMPDVFATYPLQWGRRHKPAERSRERTVPHAPPRFNGAADISRRRVEELEN